MAVVIGVRWGRAAVVMAAWMAVAGGALWTWSSTALGQARGTAAAATQNGGEAARAYQRAKTLYEQGKYKEAAPFADRALSLDPKNTDAGILKQAIAQRLATAAGAGGGATGPAATGPAGSQPAVTALLTPAQVSALRLAELHEGETGLVGKVDHKVLVQFWNEVIKKQPGADVSRQAQDAFLNPANFSLQVAQIRAANLPEYLSKIQMQSDPADMVVFRTRVHPFVLQNCATATCHAGPKAGNLRLFRPAGTTVIDQILYTNFYILATYTRPAAGGGEERMINRDEPRKSLLLQYGLPKSIATSPHPGKVEVRRLADENSPEFVGMVEWIRSLTFPTPVYVLPEAAPATAPGGRAR
jgi:hypothetical protein